jgi:RNA polymerase sigma-70 factor, ECF subfamily
MSDEELVRAVLAGDPESYRSLVDRHAPMIFHALRQRGCPENEVEDLAQDAFVRAYEGLGGFRGTAAFSSWLYQIAMNLNTDRLRRRQRGGEPIIMEDLPDDLAAPATTRTLEHTEMKKRLYLALDQLPEKYAEPFRLLYEEELSYEEIAERLDISPNALRVRVHRARTYLRLHLTDIL